MKIILVLLSVFLLSNPVAAQSGNYFNWTEAQLAVLRQLVENRAAEGLENCQISRFDQPDSATDPHRQSRLATVAATELMQAYLNGCSSDAARAGWNISSDDAYIETQQLLLRALLHNDLTGYFQALRPRNPHYHALRKAYATETDPERRATLAVNMERWRWMPLAMGKTYLLVNAASFEVTLWKDNMLKKTWPVIVGKTKSPTPIFDATVSGAILNPWWEIPTSIVAEGIGAMVRNNPVAARRKGYVLQNGRYRQRPGPGNALGQMKLIMPNRFSVYLHDTSNKNLFDQPVRTFSHGCIRVGGAIDLVKTLLDGAVSAEEVDAILASRKTTKLQSLEAIPVYIAYFTAESAADGSVRYFPDIYKRDRLTLARSEPALDCPA